MVPGSVGVIAGGGGLLLAVVGKSDYDRGVLPTGEIHDPPRPD